MSKMTQYAEEIAAEYARAADKADWLETLEGDRIPDACEYAEGEPCDWRDALILVRDEIRAAEDDARQDARAA